jgi:transposase-like protein
MEHMRTIRTPEKRTQFLQAIIDHAGNVTAACAAAGISKRAAYDWREADPEFKEAWDDAVDLTTEALEQEVYRRAHDGCEEPVFYQGQMCGTIRRYSDTLAMFTLKARNPTKYRDNSKLELGGANGGPIQVNVTYETPK